MSECAQAAYASVNVSVCTRASSSVGRLPSLGCFTAFSLALIAAHLLISTVVRAHLLCISTPPPLSPPSILSHTGFFHPNYGASHMQCCCCLMAVLLLNGFIEHPPNTHKLSRLDSCVCSLITQVNTPLFKCFHTSSLPHLKVSIQCIVCNCSANAGGQMLSQLLPAVTDLRSSRVRRWLNGAAFCLIESYTSNN